MIAIAADADVLDAGGFHRVHDVVEVDLEIVALRVRQERADLRDADDALVR